ncbi:AAA family ATPase [Aldersonia sp. NBC_00410]|uniref:AAA family ATPase n=1 Tax=Aldersonia sp. NBC_00410 TaxID=2975954 RepID=UPI002254AA2F|nr:AAA family ATPase [Aldersonia sp. NBC_00410]MCX5042474.1 AAA family ATPase [Aldersonia sp. NBC_00410]
MQITVLADRRYPSSTGTKRIVLRPDNWNDFGFTTLYDLYYDSGQHIVDLGGVKIGYVGIVTLTRPLEPGRHGPLGNNYFSVGQDDSYYRRIQELGPLIREDILTSLRDIAIDHDSFSVAESEPVTETSLFRSINARMVTGQFRRIARGGSHLVSYQFQYHLPQQDHFGRHPILDFTVIPDSHPPTNLHVLIGRNGVGKTTLLRNLVRSLVTDGADRSTGSVKSLDGTGIPFVNMVMIAFSAFDPFHEFEKNDDAASKIEFSHVGLTSRIGRKDEESQDSRKPGYSLDSQFVSSLRIVLASTTKKDRWLSAIETLENDPLFESYDIGQLANFTAPKSPGHSTKPPTENPAQETFNTLSSGHKIVLLTITRVVEKVSERTLVLLDEPESHLHPPLLAALLRALSDLLTERNGVAFIATHSPVVLQEVPSRCVWVLRRHGDISNAERPQTETFGENVGILTHDVFGLEIEGSGFHRDIREAVSDAATYQDVLERFEHQLGSEARGLARILMTEKDLTGEIP